MLANQNDLITMVNKRGRVIYVKMWEIDLERGKGSKVIVNPKEDYYPAYDQELNQKITPDILLENADISDVLECEEL